MTYLVSILMIFFLISLDLFYKFFFVVLIILQLKFYYVSKNVFILLYPIFNLFVICFLKLLFWVTKNYKYLVF